MPISKEIVKKPVAEATIAVANEVIKDAEWLKAFPPNGTHVFWEMQNNRTVISLDTQLEQPLYVPFSTFSFPRPNILQALITVEDENGAANLGINVLWTPEQKARMDKDSYARFVLDSFVDYYHQISAQRVIDTLPKIANCSFPLLSDREIEEQGHKYIRPDDLIKPELIASLASQ